MRALPTGGPGIDPQQREGAEELVAADVGPGRAEAGVGQLHLGAAAGYLDRLGVGQRLCSAPIRRPRPSRRPCRWRAAPRPRRRAARPRRRRGCRAAFAPHSGGRRSWARQYWNRSQIRDPDDSRPSGGYRRAMERKVAAIGANDLSSRTATVHGRSVGYLEAGSGELLLLIHGMAGNAENWRAVIEPLALGNTVIAPDFPGHGESAPGGGDYSLGSLASGLRDLMLTLGHERATLVGHSLGGGVAMQFTYQFPEMVERLVLVSSGGLGPEVSPILQGGGAARRRPLHLRHRGHRRPAPAPWSGADSAARPRSQRRRRRGRPRLRARSPTPSAARPSSRPCTRSSAPTASASPPSTASTWPRTCRS